ncbi:MAG: hypothetical protein R3E08_12470 [Thiotrichaceae bacterium]
MMLPLPTRRRVLVALRVLAVPTGQGGFVVHTPVDGYAGCAVGSTLVARLNTKMVSIQELFEKGGKHWVFAAHRPLLISNFIISGASCRATRAATDGINASGTGQ